MIRLRTAVALSLTCAALFSFCFLYSSAPVSVRAQRMAEHEAAPHIEAARKALKKRLYTEALKEAEEALIVAPLSAPALLVKSEALLGIYAEEYFKLSEEERDSRRRQIKQTAENMEGYSISNLKADEANAWREQLEIVRGYVKRWQPQEAAKSKAAEASEGDVLSAREVITKAHVLSKPQPEYTGTSGTVVLRAILSSEGRVESIVVIKGLTPLTAHEAVKAARRIKFTPARKGGRPVSQYVTIEYHFVG